MGTRDEFLEAVASRYRSERHGHLALDEARKRRLARGAGVDHPHAENAAAMIRRAISSADRKVSAS